MNETAQRLAAMGEKTKVLLVDDRPENLLALEGVLKPLGQEMVCVSSGEEALGALLDDEFAVILMDVRMPGMDGFETAARIKHRERTRHVPIIFLTAVNDDLDTALRGYSEGAVDYITKPFNPSMLRSKVAVFVELHLKTRMLREQTRLLQESNTDLAALAEAADKASRAKSAFLNMVGHELRTPLTVVSGYAAMLRAGDFGDVDERMMRPLTVLEEKADELAELVETLLSAAQIESGSVPESAEPLEVAEVVTAAVDRARGRAQLVKAEIVVGAIPSHLRVEFDRGHIGRVLDNLINNALAYGGENPWVRISVSEDRDHAVIAVEDHGDGIPVEMHERVFERFVRGSQPGAGPPGSGLGLYVCRELLERRGATLELTSSVPGEGSCFTVRLPLLLPQPARVAVLNQRRRESRSLTG
jgi:signal transduction histidine kinase